MEPYQKQLLEKITALSEESNKILRGLRRQARWGVFFSLVKWAIIIAPLVWAYIYFQPYLGSFKDILQKLPEQLQTIEGIGNQIEGAKDFLKNPPKIPI